MSDPKQKRNRATLAVPSSLIAGSTLIAGVSHGEAEINSDEWIVLTFGEYGLNADGSATISVGNEVTTLASHQFMLVNNVLYISAQAMTPTMLAQMEIASANVSGASGNAMAGAGVASAAGAGLAGFSVFSIEPASGNQQANINVPPANPGPIVVPDNDSGTGNSVATVFSAGSHTFTVAQGATLPPNLALDSVSGEISGIAQLPNPFIAETASIGLEAINGLGSNETATMTFGVPLNVTPSDLAPSSSATMQGGDFADSVVLGDSVAESNGTVAITTNDGDDTIRLGNLAAYGYGEVTINAGAGNDSIEIGNSAAWSGATVAINANDGDDVVTIGDSAAAGTSGGSFFGAVSIDLGNGTDDLTVGNKGGAYGGYLAITGGTGIDTINIGDDVGRGSGNVMINLEDGDDQLTVGYGAAKDGGQVNVNMGNGNNRIIFGDAAADEGMVNIYAADGDDHLTLGATGVTDAYNTVDAAFNGTMFIGLGDGDNVIDVMGYGASYGGSMTIMLGTGDDVVTFSEPVAEVRGSATINLGNGTNALTFNDHAASNSGSVSITAGTGVDTIRFEGNAGAFNPSYGSPVNGTVTIDLNNDSAADSILFQGDVFGTTISNLSVGDTISFTRSVSIVSGNGTNSITLSGPSINVTLVDTGTVTLSPTSAGTMFTVV